MTKEMFKVQTERGDLFKIPIDDLLRWDLEYSPQIARFDFKDGTFIEFIRSNLTYIQKVKACEYRISKGKVEILENKLKGDNTWKVKGDRG